MLIKYDAKKNLRCFTEGLYIEFEKPQRGIAAGQFAAWYDKEELIGSGVINYLKD